uniref:F-box domain-containing protein n=1 Tax=Oryzias sinensis TaxID=183150 RepID=A0A8C7XEV5_9TELE
MCNLLHSFFIARSLVTIMGKRICRSYGQQTHKARLLKKQSVRTATSLNHGGTCGPSFFQRLPIEVLHIILDQLSVLEMSVFSMVSKEITKYILDYISSQKWRNKTIIQSFHPSACPEQRCTVEHYRHLGLLYKRCTLLLPTKDRLKLIFSKFSQIPCFMLEQCFVPGCTAFVSFGVFLKTLIAGWDEPESHRVFNCLCVVTNLMQKTEGIITAKPGVKPHRELQLRLFCRCVLLDPWANQPECQFWLTQLLKPWPMVSQAHLLFILYGPLQPGGILGWQDVVERALTPGSLWSLAEAISILFGKPEVKGWTTPLMFSIVMELTAVPEPWHLENLARFLLLCGNHVSYTVLASKALFGHVTEVSRLIIYIILVCEKDGYHMSWVVNIVQQIFKVFSTSTERFFFIQHLENSFSQLTREIFESTAENQAEDREMLFILLESSARFHTKFLHTLLK